MTKPRPRIPREWYAPSPWRTSAFVLFALAMLFVPGLLAAHVVSLGLSWWATLLLVLPLVVLTGHGVHLTGWVGHEGLHCNLHRNKYVSFFIGIVVGATGTSSVVGHALNHWNHHRFVNTDSDPDAQMYAQYKTFRSRIFGPRATSHSSFHRYTVLCALGRELPVGFRLPFPPATARRLAWFGLFMLGACALGWLTVLILNPVYGLLGYVVPALLVAGPVSSWRVFAEHADTDTGLWTNSRSYAHWLYTLLFFGNNYHLEHHLYPGVPCYYLPRVHRYLRERGYYEQSFIDRDFWGPLGLTRASHFYPAAAGQDLEHDPFRADVADHPEQGERLADDPEPALVAPGGQHA
jgi:beta-carotene hydroxylase